MLRRVAKPSPQPDLRPAVADHDLLERIGVGAYGEVWMARGITGALRAVKIVRRDNFDHDRTYEREFAGLKKFEPISRAHEGFVDILQIGRNDQEGYFYCVMELADNADPEGTSAYRPLTVSELMRGQGKLSVPVAARIGASIAGALAFLHQHGLVHRDVKPSNLIFVNGHAKLADIGLVASVGEARSFVGTDGFIPPEGPGAPPADIYGLGKCLYEMATGRSRLDFPDLPGDLEATGDYAPFIELNEIILRACAPTAQGRHGSAEELRGELLLVDAGRSIRGMRRNERMVKIGRRVGAATLFIIALSLMAFIVERRRAENAQSEARAQRQQRQLVEEKELVARQNLYAADMNLTQQAVEMGNYGRAEDLLAEYLPAPGRRELRGFEWFYYWKRVRGDSVAVLKGHEYLVSSLAWGRKPGQLFSASFDETVREWSLPERREIKRWDLPGSLFTGLALDASGSKLAAEGDRALTSLLDLATGQWQTNSTTGSSQIAFTSEGNQSVRGSRFKLFDTNGVIQLTDLQFNVQRELPESGAHFAFSPAGNLLATGTWGDAIKLWSWPQLEPLGNLSGAGIVLALSFSPDGNWLATVTRDGRLCLWDVAQRQLAREFKAHGGTIVWSVAFSPDGKWLATGGNDQAVRVWDVETLRERHAFRGHGSEVWAVIWSRDGGQIISAGKDATIRIWNAAPATEAAEISTSLQRPIFSPDCRRVAAVDREGGVVIWETGSNQVAGRVSDVLDMGGFGRAGASLFVLGSGWEVKEVGISDGRIFTTRKLVETGVDASKRVMSPDGRWVVTGHRNGDVYAYDSHGNGAPKLLAGHKEMIVALAFSPDNARVLAGSIDRTARLWDLQTGESSHRFDGHRMGVGSVAFSPDGRLIATGSWDDTVHVWDAQTSKRLMILAGHGGGVQAVAFTPDNRTLVSLTGTSILKFWSLPAQREAGQLHLPPGYRQGWISVSADGEWLAAVSQAEALTLLHAPRENSAEVR